MTEAQVEQNRHFVYFGISPGELPAGEHLNENHEVNKMKILFTWEEGNRGQMEGFR